MSPASSTSEQTPLTRDVNGLQNFEENSVQSQHVVTDDNVQHRMQASEEVHILDKDKTHSSSPSMAGSSADMALVSPPPSPSAENITNDNDCKLTTLGMTSSDATPNINCIEVALLPEPVIEGLTMSRDLLPPFPGDSQNSQVKPLDPQTTLPTALDCSPCSAPDSASSVPDDIPNDAELFVTRHVTYAAGDHRPPSGPTTTLSSPDTSDKMDPPSADSDAHFTPCEGLLYQNIRSQSCKAGTPSLSPTPGALLTSLLAVDTLARDSSPSHPEPSSDVFMHSTPPLSSPQMESNFRIIGNSTRNRDDSCTSDDAKIDDYPAITMSSPNFPLHGDEFSISSSPPYPTTGTKRARYDDSDEEPTSAKPIKRVRTDDTMSSPLRNPPAPRRATLASQNLSRKRLAAPFRSPLQTKTMSTQLITPALPEKDAHEQIAREPRVKYQIKPKSAQEAPSGTSKAVRSLVRSSRAAAQFRSPLMKVPEHTSRPLVLPNQTIMNLERKLTILRRAAKIKRDGDEAHLERLAKKWRDAGREAAYELWGIVRDLSTEGGEMRGNGNDNGWGWGEQGEQGISREDDVDTEAGEHAEKQENTLGVMLRKLGIAPETLGWNEEEEAFVDNERE